MDSKKYRKIVWGYKKGKEAGCLYLTPNDLHHLRRIFKKYSLKPESIEHVRVEFLIQKEKLARYIIKELDILLKVDGIFELVLMDSKEHSSYTRSRDQVKYEMSISTNGRYRQTAVNRLQNNKILHMLYKKAQACLPADDTIDKWSFGIITNGKKNQQVEKLIKSIIQQKIPHYEIVICGPYENTQNHPHLVMLDDVMLTDDIRAPIAAKKNKIIEIARYNNLCILHDRFSLPVSWYQNMREYGNYFDFLCLPTLDYHGRRFTVDWMEFCFPITRTCVRNKTMKYSQISSEQIIQGGVILGKKHIISQSMLDARLHWEELEDMHFSKMVYLNGAFINTDVKNYLISDAVNHQAEKLTKRARKLREKIAWLRGLFSNFLRFHLCRNKYYQTGN